MTVATAAVAPTADLSLSVRTHLHEPTLPHACFQSGDYQSSDDTVALLVAAHEEYNGATILTAEEARYGGPQTAFALALERMPDVVRECMEGGQPGTDLGALCEGLGHQPPQESALDVLRLSQVINAKECAALRAAVDANQSCLPDSVDKMPEHQLDLSQPELASLIGMDAMARLWLLPKRLFSQRASGIPNGSSDSSDSDEPMGPSWIHPEPKYRAEIFIRRYSNDTRPWIGFHRDACAVTVNVSLGNDEDHEGGRLLVVLDEGVQVLVRGMGDVTVHPSCVLHAVSAMKSGTRYSLLIFFYHQIRGDAT